MRTKNTSYIYAAFTIFFWGTAASAFKLTLQYSSSIQLLAWASFASTIALGGIIFLSKKGAQLKKLTRKQIIQAMWLGLLNPLAYYFVIFSAYNLLPAQIAQPLNFIWPLVLVLLSAPLLGHKITRKNVFALIASFIGVIFIASQGSITGFSAKSPLGIALALGSAIIWAFYWIKNQQETGIDPAIRLFLGFVLATVIIFIVGFFTKDFGDIKLKGLLGAFYIGFFEMGITFYLWQKALTLASDKAKLGNTIYLVPFLSLIFIRLLVGETIYWTTIAGLVIIVSSIVFQQVSNPNKKHMP